MLAPLQKLGFEIWVYFTKRPWVLAAIIICFASFSFFGEVAEDVLEGDTHALDEKILLMFRDAGDTKSPIGPPWLEEMMRDFTGLGGIGVLTLVSLLSFIYLLTIHRHAHALFLLTAVWSATILSNVMKAGFDRPRPDLVPHGSITYLASFPSGHSFLSAVVYLTLGVILAEVEKNYAMKIFLISIACGISVLVGISRVYLGVHWPSDVLAGWLVGIGWALLFWVLAHFLKEHRLLRKNKEV